VGSYGHGNEPLDSIKGGEFIEYVSNYQLLKEDCGPLRLFQTREEDELSVNNRKKSEQYL
jgi:hypothetical protein